MPTPSKHKAVHARLLAYARAIGRTIVSREEAEQQRGIAAMTNASLFFDNLLDARVREFHLRYAEAEGALLGQFRHLHTDIHGNEEFVEHLSNRGKLFDHEEKREGDQIQDLLRTLLHELMTAKAHVHAVEFTSHQASGE